MTLAELIALIGLEVDKGAQKKVEDQLDGFAGKLAGWADRATEVMSTAFLAFFANDLYDMAKRGVGRVLDLFNPQSVFEQTKAYAGLNDEIAKSARSLGITTEALQRYRFIAGQNGIEQKVFEMSLNRVNKSIGEANRGTKSYQKTLQDLGVDYQMLATKDGEERIDTILGALAGITDESKRTALGIRLLGDRAFPKFATLLKGGTKGLDDLKKKADELGFIVSDEDAQKAEAFNDALDRTQRTFGSLLNRALQPLLEPLTLLLDGLTDLVVQNKDLLALPFEAFGQVFVFVFGTGAKAVRGLVNVLKGANKRVSDFVKRMGGMKGIMQVVLMLTTAFMLAWIGTNQALVLRFMATMILRLKVIAVQMLLASRRAFAFMLNLSRAQLWAAIQRGFAILNAALNSTMVKFILLAALFFGAFLILEDIFFFLSGENSLIGEKLGLDPKNIDQLELMYGLFIAIGAIVAVVAAIIGGIPLLIAILIGLLAYVIYNWEEIGSALQEVFNNLLLWLEKSSKELAQWASGIGDKVADVFRGIVEAIKNMVKEGIQELMEIPAAARGLLKSIPGLGGVVGGVELAAQFAGPGSINPNVDAEARFLSTRNNRSITIAPQITVPIDATGKSVEEAQGIAKAEMFDELFKELEDAYEGEED